jgi:hypothetical protein
MQGPKSPSKESKPEAKTDEKPSHRSITSFFKPKETPKEADPDEIVPLRERMVANNPAVASLLHLIGK